jgi:hypothetical protein
MAAVKGSRIIGPMDVKMALNLAARKGICWVVKMVVLMDNVMVYCLVSISAVKKEEQYSATSDEK